MPVQLEIDDGNPWYLSPDIWVIPGNDPNGAPGIPMASQPSYIWARVHNRGKAAIANATVHYYWADPSTTITQNTATLVGTSYVSLIAGQTAEVLCLTLWTPSWVNGGHECLIAEAFSAEDPLPPRTPNDPFNPPRDRHMAQLNINLLPSMHRMSIFPFLAGNTPGLRTEEITIKAKRASIELLDRLKENLGLQRLPEEIKDFSEFGLLPYHCGDQVREVGEPNATFALSPGAQQGMALVVQLPEHQANTGALFLIEEYVHNQVIGGIGALILSQAEKDEEQDPKRRKENA